MPTTAPITTPAGPAQPTVDLYWIPVGAGGWCVRRNARAYERIRAAIEHRPPEDLYHAALVVALDGERFAIELAPSPDADHSSRGVVATGPVGSRRLGALRLFRYELRCWRGGAIPDLAYAAGPPCRLTTSPAVARRLVGLAARVPTLVWGRDELGVGEMWNSNSVIAWVLASAGLPAAELRPPAGGRAPGWDAGVIAAHQVRQPRLTDTARASRRPDAGTAASASS
jgi:hypothetical protein